MSRPNSESNTGANVDSGTGGGAGADMRVTVDARPDQRLIPRKESFRHVDLLVRAAKAPTATHKQREPLTLALVLDRSGSMSGGKIETAKRAALAVIEGLDEQDTAAVVIFDDKIDVLQPAAHVSQGVKQEMRRRLRDVNARGSTALHEGWLTGCKAIASDELTPLADGVARCFLLTDGLANVGLTDPEQIATQAASIRQRGGIGTSTFGIGDDYAEELLGPMAEAGGGRFHHLRTADEIATTFVNELGELLATVASNVKLELEVEPGVIVEVVSTFWATPAPEDPARWTITMGDLFSGEERHAVVRLGFQDQPQREEQAVRARVVWTADGTEHTSAWVEVRFAYADDAAVGAETVDAGVLELAGQHLADRTQREALRRSKSGDMAGALRAMTVSREQLSLYERTAPALSSEVAEMDAMLAEMAEGPIVSARSKELYFQRQARTHGKQDLRGGSMQSSRFADATAMPTASPEQVQQLLAGYIKSSLAWPRALPDDLPTELLRDRVRGCVLWGAAGDALGRPLEGLRADEIVARYGRDGLTRYLPPLDWRSGPKGVLSSVTSLTIELARSLIASDGRFKPEDFAHRLAVWQSNGRTVGHATTQAIHLLAAGVPWWQTGDRRSGGCGAGVRAAPVGLAHALDANPLELRQAAVLAALPTHANASAVAGAVALAAGVAWLVREVARGADQVDAVELTSFVSSAIAGIEPPAADGGPQLARRLRDLPADLAKAATGQASAYPFSSGLALDAVPAAFYHFLRAPDDPRQVVLAAANAGGSAPSIAGMAGQLAGAWRGAERLWRDATAWWDELEARDELRGLGDQVGTLTLKAAGRS